VPEFSIIQDLPSVPEKESSLKPRGKSQTAIRARPTCKDEVGLIADYLTGQLNPKVLAAFEKHLSQCPDCTAFLSTYKKTIDATKSFLKIQSPNIRPRRLQIASKLRGLLAPLLFWLHLFIANATLTA
jgi:anti-sigma factor RsiW